MIRASRVPPFLLRNSLTLFTHTVLAAKCGTRGAHTFKWTYL